MSFLDEDFLLGTETARRLFHEYAGGMPIFDYHCHLPVAEIAENRQFENLSRLWLAGDHYKWRAMRAFGIEERLITGDASDWEKFEAWAATVPFTVRNPLYHWTHMELKDPFGLSGKLLGPQTAREIYDHCNALLRQEGFRARGLMAHFDVRVVCTTDDPTDSLEHHRRLAEELGSGSFRIKVLPAFRPDKAMAVDSVKGFIAWVVTLEKAADMVIGDYATFREALASRHDFFHQAGCRLSDHGIEQPYAADYTEREIEAIFKKVRAGAALQPEEVLKFKSAVLFELAVMDAEAGWVQQFGCRRTGHGLRRHGRFRNRPAAGPLSGRSGQPGQAGPDDRVHSQPEGQRDGGLDPGQLPERDGTRKDAARFGLVVQRSDRRHDPAAGGAVQHRVAFPLRGYAHRFAQLPFLPQA
jgi:glucuronate isomerase